MEATITSKGQITLPKSFRDKYSLRPGEKLVFVEELDGSTRILVRRNNVDALVGILKARTNVKRSISDLSEAAEHASAASYRDSLK